MMGCFAFFASWDCPLRAHVLPLDVMRRRLATAVDELADDLVAALEYYHLPGIFRPHAHARYMDCLCAITTQLPPDLVPPGKRLACHQWWLTGGRVDEALIRSALHQATGYAWYWHAANNLTPHDNADWVSDTERMSRTIKLLRRCHQAQGELRREERRSLRAARTAPMALNHTAHAY